MVAPGVVFLLVTLGTMTVYNTGVNLMQQSNAAQGYSVNSGGSTIQDGDGDTLVTTEIVASVSVDDIGGGAVADTDQIHFFTAGTHAGTVTESQFWGLGTLSPLARLHVNTSGQQVGHFQTTGSTADVVVQTTDHTYKLSVSGGAFLVYDVSNSAARLTVGPTGVVTVSGGTVLSGSVTIPTGASNGHVLTSDGSGVATWQAASGGDVWSDWSAYADPVMVCDMMGTVNFYSSTTTYGGISYRTLGDEVQVHLHWGYLGLSSNGTTYSGHTVEGDRCEFLLPVGTVDAGLVTDEWYRTGLNMFGLGFHVAGGTHTMYVFRASSAVSFSYASPTNGATIPSSSDTSAELYAEFSYRRDDV